MVKVKDAQVPACSTGTGVDKGKYVQYHNTNASSVFMYDNLVKFVFVLQ